MVRIRVRAKVWVRTYIHRKIVDNVRRVIHDQTHSHDQVDGSDTIQLLNRHTGTQRIKEMKEGER